MNCIMLAMYDPLDRDCSTNQCRILEALEKLVFTFFAAEMVMKMIAMGLYGSRSYFSDGWNILDFFIVIAGIVDMIGQRGDYLTIVRLGRVLRPLRAINRVPSIRILVTLLLDTIPMLGNVLFLAFLVFSIFGIIGVQAWQGKLRNRCFLNSVGQNLSVRLNLSSFYIPHDDQLDFVCSLPTDSGMQTCNKIPSSCNLQSNASCTNKNQYYTECLQRGDNPYYGSISFDNIALSWIFIYQVVTLEGWSELMYLIQDTTVYWSWIYFVILITIGSFFLVNLSLVVITMQFSETKRREMQLISEQKRMERTVSQLSLVSDIKLLWHRLSKYLKGCKKQERIHHFHHHEHFHIHTHTFHCDSCKGFCGVHEESVAMQSPKVPGSEPVIPKVEISCFDDEQHHLDGGANDTRSTSLKNMGSCPQLDIYQKPRQAKIDDNPAAVLRQDEENSNEGKVKKGGEEPKDVILLKNDIDPHRQLRRKLSDGQTVVMIGNKSHEQLKRKLSDSQTVVLIGDQLPTTLTGQSRNSIASVLSIHAESVSSVVSVEGNKTPRKTSLQTRTSLSLQINGTSAQLNSSAEATALVDTKRGSAKAMANASSTIAHSLSGHRKLGARSSNASHTSEPRDNLLDFNDTSSEALYGSMFDLKNADKYYVSEDPTFFQRFRQYCKRISDSRKFSHGIMLIIVINTICMGLEHHNQPKSLTNVLEIMNLVFIWIFGFEMCVKMLGSGLKEYFKQGYNVFDCLVVMVSVVELLIDKSGSSGGSNIIVLRSLRLLRIFKLVRPMRHQLVVMIRTMSSVMTFFALLFLFMFTFAILGMHLFGDKFMFDGKVARSNFDSFLWAMVTVFQILTQEDWNKVMYDGIRGTRTKWAALYFIFLMTIGYYVLLNLLVAILVEGFTTPMEKKRMAKRIAVMLLNKSRSTSRSPFLRNKCSSVPDMTPCSPFIYQSMTDINDNEQQFLGLALNRGRRKTWAPSQITSPWAGSSELATQDDSAVQYFKKAKPKPGEPVLLSAKPRSSSTGNAPELFHPLAMIRYEATSESSTIYSSDNCLRRKSKCSFLKQRANWSLYLLSPTNRCRRVLQAISSNKWFDYFILLLISYSCVLIAMETPSLPKNSKRRYFIDTSMFVLTWIFTVEMLIKVVAQGFVIGPDTYLKNGWNCLDGLLVLMSWIDIIVTFTSSGSNQAALFKALRVFRALRSLRPLRMIQRAPGLKLVVQTLLYSLKPIGNTVLIAAIFFIVFGILGVQLMKGKFYYCQDAPMVINRTECEANPKGTWVNRQYNFDNLLRALVALFVVSTKDGWVEIMRHGLDAKGVGLQPVRDYAPWRILYFVSFLLIGGFLVLNMIVGVVVENFQRCREMQGDEEKAKKALDKWRVAAGKATSNGENFYEQYSKPRLLVYKLCTHSYWDIGVTMVILVNIICMALEHYRMSTAMLYFVEISNYVFTAFYVTEAALQITALGIRYFKQAWYIFDFTIVVVSVFGIILEKFILKGFTISPGVVRGMRMLRVVRVLKLLKMAKGLRFLLDHVRDTLPQVTNLALLFSLLFFVYSCLGIQLFGTLECTEENPCAGLSEHANFKDVGQSMLTLFRIATGDNWSGILKDTLRPGCDDSSTCSKNCCLSTYSAPFYFVTFVLFAQFVLVNIVVAVLMKHLRVTKLCKKKDNKKKKKKSRQNAPTEAEKEARRHAMLGKWHQKALKQLNDRNGSVDSGKSFVRTKRSTDGLDNIKLKQFKMIADSDSLDNEESPLQIQHRRAEVEKRQQPSADSPTTLHTRFRIEKEHSLRRKIGQWRLTSSLHKAEAVDEQTKPKEYRAQFSRNGSSDSESTNCSLHKGMVAPFENESDIREDCGPETKERIAVAGDSQIDDKPDSMSSEDKTDYTTLEQTNKSNETSTVDKGNCCTVNVNSIDITSFKKDNSDKNNTLKHRITRTDPEHLLITIPDTEDKGPITPGETIRLPKGPEFDQTIESSNSSSPYTPRMHFFPWFFLNTEENKSNELERSNSDVKSKKLQDDKIICSSENHDISKRSCENCDDTEHSSEQFDKTNHSSGNSQRTGSLETNVCESKDLCTLSSYPLSRGSSSCPMSHRSLPDIVHENYDDTDSHSMSKKDTEDTDDEGNCKRASLAPRYSEGSCSSFEIISEMSPSKNSSDTKLSKPRVSTESFAILFDSSPEDKLFKATEV